MAIPALPSDDSDGNDWNAAKVNAIYDHIQLWRDTRPLFKGQHGTADAGAYATATTYELGHGTSSATFLVTPLTNIGAFTVASVANGDSVYNIEVSEAGHFEGFWNVSFSADTGGYRSVIPLLNSVTIVGSTVTADAMSGAATLISAPFEVDCADNDELSVDIFQNSGNTLSVDAWLFVKWVQST